jgi:hypothetical protein
MKGSSRGAVACRVDEFAAPRGAGASFPRRSRGPQASRPGPAGGPNLPPSGRADDRADRRWLAVRRRAGRAAVPSEVRERLAGAVRPR